MNVGINFAGKMQVEPKGNIALTQAQLPLSDPSAFLSDLASKLNANANSQDKANLNSLGEKPAASSDEDLRQAFQDFVGQTLFSQMIASMRSTQGDVAYFNGGRAEKIFQGQLDQILSEELSDASASKISDPMFKLFQLRRQ